LSLKGLSVCGMGELVGPCWAGRYPAQLTLAHATRETCDRVTMAAIREGMRWQKDMTS